MTSLYLGNEAFIKICIKIGGFRKPMTHILKRKMKIFDYPRCQIVAIFSLSNLRYFR